MRITAIIGDWLAGTLDGEVPLWRRVVRATFVLAALYALVVPLAHAGIIRMPLSRACRACSTT